MFLIERKWVKIPQSSVGTADNWVGTVRDDHYNVSKTKVLCFDNKMERQWSVRGNNSIVCLKMKCREECEKYLHLVGH